MNLKGGPCKTASLTTNTGTLGCCRLVTARSGVSYSWYNSQQRTDKCCITSGSIAQPRVGGLVPKSVTMYVYQTHRKFHTSIKHSITLWNRTVCFYSQAPKYWTNVYKSHESHVLRQNVQKKHLTNTCNDVDLRLEMTS